jgi:hypothetical protein
MIRDEEVDVLEQAQAVSTLVRIAARIPNGRVPREAQSVGSYLASINQTNEATAVGTTSTSQRARNGAALGLEIDQHEEAIDANPVDAPAS